MLILKVWYFDWFKYQSGDQLQSHSVTIFHFIRTGPNHDVTAPNIATSGHLVPSVLTKSNQCYRSNTNRSIGRRKLLGFWNFGHYACLILMQNLTSPLRWSSFTAREVLGNPSGQLYTFWNRHLSWSPSKHRQRPTQWELHNTTNLSSSWQHYRHGDGTGSLTMVS